MKALELKDREMTVEQLEKWVNLGFSTFSTHETAISLHNIRAVNVNIEYTGAVDAHGFPVKNYWLSTRDCIAVVSAIHPVAVGGFIDHLLREQDK